MFRKTIPILSFEFHNKEERDAFAAFLQNGDKFYRMETLEQYQARTE